MKKINELIVGSKEERPHKEEKINFATGVILLILPEFLNTFRTHIPPI